MRYQRSPAAFLILFFVFFFIGIYFLSQGVSLGQNSIKTQGTIIELVPHEIYHKYVYQTVYYSRISYFTPDGKEFELEAQTDGKIGDKVEIAYDPNDPNVANINKGYELYGSPVILILISMASLGCYIYIQNRRKRETAILSS